VGGGVIQTTIYLGGNNLWERTLANTLANWNFTFLAGKGMWRGELEHTYILIYVGIWAEEFIRQVQDLAYQVGEESILVTQQTITSKLLDCATGKEVILD
jgi:hypothetical protein